MIDRSYRCNLCRDAVDPQAMFGLYWTGVGKCIERRPPMQVEHHICLACASQIVIMWEQYAKEHKEEDHP